MDLSFRHKTKLMNYIYNLGILLLLHFVNITENLLNKLLRLRCSNLIINSIEIVPLNIQKLINGLIIPYAFVRGDKQRSL